jgi:putative hydrolase of the HAD superfamily
VAAIVDSRVFGLEKPDPRILAHALEAVGADASEATHVGDSVRSDVRGAERAGITPVHYDPYGLCRASDHRHVRALAEL